MDGVRVMLQLATMHGESQVESTILGNLIVMSLDDELPRSYTRDEIPADSPVS